MPNSFQMRQVKQKKNQEKQEFYAKTVIEKMDFGLWFNS